MNLPIRIRLTLWYLGTLLVLLILFSTYFMSQAYFTLLEQTDRTLALAADQALNRVELGPEPGFTDELALRASMVSIDHDLKVMLVAPDGSSYQQVTDTPFLLKGLIELNREKSPPSPPAAEGNVASRETRHFEVTTYAVGDAGVTSEVITFEALPTVIPEPANRTVGRDGLRWRFHSQPVPSASSGAVWVQVAQSLDPLDMFVSDMLMQLLWGVLLALVLAGLVGHWMAGRALKPIAYMTSAAQEISARDLDRRIDYQGAKDEIGRLAATMDSMFDRLQSAFERERRFTGDAAHELRTPLTALKGNIEVTLSRVRQPEEYVKAVASMGKQVERLIHLSNDLLFMARFDQQGTRGITKTRVDLNDVLSLAVAQIQPLAVQKEITLDEEISSELKLEGNPELLLRLFLNLLDNAIKFTSERGTVSVLARRRHECIEVQVCDDGVGIPADHLPHLFKRFFRVEQHRARHPSQSSGSGLGLAIAQEIVHLHGGTISVHSKIDQGTTMSICFPN